MGVTISGSNPHGVDLTDPADNPVTVTGTIGFDGTNTTFAALQGETVATWNVTNQGTIDGGTDNFGVDLLAGGTVTNVATGWIDGFDGVVLQGTAVADILMNSGTIDATLAADPTESGVLLTHGGTVANLAGGQILSAGDGITFQQPPSGPGAGSVVNAGTIDAGADGVDMQDGGGVTIQMGGQIFAAQYGVFVENATGSVENAGTINAGAGTYGIFLDAGGSVTNLTGGQIVAASDAIATTGTAATVVNDGTVVANASNAAAVDLVAGGSVTNIASGTLSGGFGVAIQNATTGVVVNDGLISGTAAAGLFLNNLAGVTVNNQAGGQISGDPAIEVFSGAGTVINAGTIVGTGSEAVLLSSGFANLVAVDAGAVFTGTVDGGNTIGAGAISTLELASDGGPGTIAGLGTQFINFGSLQFDPGADWFVAGDTAGLAGAIGGFAFGDTIEVDGIVATGSDYADGVLTLTEASGSATLALAGTFSTGEFLVTNVADGAEVTLMCFRTGTRIRTPRGEVPVEQLAVGEQVAVLLDGSAAPIIWIGRRTVDCSRHPKPAQAWPVRISANAFGPGLPGRDLFLSPNHAVYVGEVLIPVKRLISGTSIAQVPMDEVTYYHVELPRHDVVLAEGLPVESFLDMKDGSNYADRPGPVKLYPDFSVRMWEAFGCARLVVTGPELEAARALVGRFAEARDAA